MLILKMHMYLFIFEIIKIKIKSKILSVIHEYYKSKI